MGPAGVWPLAKSLPTYRVCTAARAHRAHRLGSLRDERQTLAAFLLLPCARTVVIRVRPETISLVSPARRGARISMRKTAEQPFKNLGISPENSALLCLDG